MPLYVCIYQGRRNWPAGPAAAGPMLLTRIKLGECSTLWGERERGTVYGGRIRRRVSSHRKLIGHIGCCRSPQLLAFSAGRAHIG